MKWILLFWHLKYEWIEGIEWLSNQISGNWIKKKKKEKLGNDVI